MRKYEDVANLPFDDTRLSFGLQFLEFQQEFAADSLRQLRLDALLVCLWVLVRC